MWLDLNPSIRIIGELVGPRDRSRLVFQLLGTALREVLLVQNLLDHSSHWRRDRAKRGCK